MASVVRSRLLLILGITSLAISAPAVALADCLGGGGGGNWQFEWTWENPPPSGGGGSTGGTEGGGTTADTHDPILFVQGWSGSMSSWTTMFNRFQASGWPIGKLRLFEYDSGQSNATTAYEISSLVDYIRSVTGASKVDLVTHSMGALSSRYYLKNLGGTAKVEDWVSLGGPNHGTNLAYGCPSTACSEMRPGSAYLNALNAGDETPGAVRYLTWRSNCDEIVPASSVPLVGARNEPQAEPTFPCISHFQLHENEVIFNAVRTFIR